MNDDITATPLHLLNLVKQAKLPTSEDVERLAQYVDFRTMTSAGADPAHRLEVSDHPGYLTTMSGGRRVFVPFQLAAVFPTEDTLARTVEVALQAQVVEGNPICISGSTTFLGRISEIGDLDFCEYHLGDTAPLPEAITAKASAAAALPLIEIKCGTTKVHHPWNELTDRMRTAMVEGREGDERAAKVKLDMVSDGELGGMPTTSIVLPLGPDKEAGNAKESFVFQEAVIAFDAPPRSLINGDSFARYCSWLLEEARALTTDDGSKSAAVRAPKALKRLLSLLLAIGDDETAEEVLNGLEGGHILQVVRSGRVAELRAFAALAGKETRGRIEAMIERLTLDAVEHVLDETQIEEAATITLEIGLTIIKQLEARMEAMERAA